MSFSIESVVFLFWVLCSAITTSLLVVEVGICKKKNDAIEKIKRFCVGHGKTLSSEDQFESFQVPKRWFSHFYVIACIIDIICFGLTVRISDWSMNSFVLLLHFFQVSRRLFECLYVTKFANAKMNVAHYLLGLAHYITVPISITISPLCSFDVTSTLFTSCILYSFAFYFQFSSIRTLANLRSPNSTQNYAIPRSGLFEYISSPHYVCEILIYLSLSMCLGFTSYFMNACFVFVLLNQSLSALASHKWYIDNFTHYPTRHALIPGIF